MKSQETELEQQKSIRKSSPLASPSRLSKIEQLGQTRHAKNQSHPLVEPQAAVAGIPAATNAREIKEGPVAVAKMLSHYLGDHPIY